MSLYLALATLLIGCGSAPSAELGTGEDSFVAIADGDEIEVIQGPQGGYHILGSVLTSNLEVGNADDLSDTTNPTVVFRVLRDSEPIDVGIQYTQGLRESDDGRFGLFGRRVILDIDSDSELDQVEVEMVVQVRDIEGTVVEDSRTLLAVPHPLNGTQY